MPASLLVRGLMSLVVVAGAATCGKEPIMADQHTPSAGASPASAPAAATQGGLELGASANGTTLHVVLRNVGQAPLRLFGAVSGPDRKHYDYHRGYANHSGYHVHVPAADNPGAGGHALVEADCQPLRSGGLDDAQGP